MNAAHVLAPPRTGGGRGTGSAIYQSVVTHRRLRPVRHAFRYRVLSVLIDLDEVEHLGNRSPMFRHNRAGVVSFFDRDHGLRDGSPLRPWIEARLARIGIDLEGGPIRILCSPRILGYVFDPLSVWFCHGRDGSLRAILYEVHNTFGGSHQYLIPVEPGASPARPIRQSCRKEFHVSPFMAMDLRYDFVVREPGERVSVAMRVEDADGPLFAASWRGDRVPFSTRALLRALSANPVSTFKVSAGIYWQALRLWLAGVPRHPKPADPSAATSCVARGASPASGAVAAGVDAA